MVDVGHPICPGKRLALGLGNGSQRHLGELAIERHEIRDVEPAMKRRHMMQFQSAAEGKMQVIDVEMDDVKRFVALKYLLEKQGVIDIRIDAFAVQSQRTRRDGHELSLRDGVSAGEERDLVAHFHEFLGQVGNHTFGSAIEAGWNTFIKRCNLSDFQCMPLSEREKPSSGQAIRVGPARRPRQRKQEQRRGGEERRLR